jgi:hypothetical protein
MLGHLRRRRRLDIGDLVTALRQHRLLLQAGTAPAARRRRVPEPLVRVIDEPHRRPRIARLLARRPFPHWRNDRSRPFFLYGLSDDGGRDDVDESLPSRRSSSSTRACSRSARAESSWA